MKKVLIIGELNKALHSAQTYAKKKYNYSFEYFNVLDMDESVYAEENFLLLIQSAVEKSDIIVFSKPNAEMCLKMILAAMCLKNKSNLIVIQNYQSYEQLFNSERIHSLLKVSGIDYAIIDFRTDSSMESFIIDVIQKKSKLKTIAINHQQFSQLCASLYADVENSLHYFTI